MTTGEPSIVQAMREIEELKAEVKRLREEVAILESEVVRRDARIALLAQPSDGKEVEGGN